MFKTGLRKFVNYTKGAFAKTSQRVEKPSSKAILESKEALTKAGEVVKTKYCPPTDSFKSAKITKSENAVFIESEISVQKIKEDPMKIASDCRKKVRTLKKELKSLKKGTPEYYQKLAEILRTKAKGMNARAGISPIRPVNNNDLTKRIIAPGTADMLWRKAERLNEKADELIRKIGNLAG